MLRPSSTRCCRKHWARELQPARSRVSRRRKLLRCTLLALLAVTALGLLWLAQPRNLAPTILSLAGDALGLEITAEGEADYRLRGTPQLVVRGLIAREPGAAQPLLTAERVLIALPWSTLRARGSDLTTTRLELDAPVLDLAAFQQWQARRPPGDMPLPTLTRGLQVTRGTLIGQDWKLQELEADLPSLAAGQPLRAHLRGRYVGNTLAIPADLQVALTKPDTGAGLGVSGNLSLEGKQWRVPAQLRLSARLMTNDGFELENAVLGASARYVSGETSLPFALGLAGPLRVEGTGTTLQLAALALRGQESMPTLDAEGGFAMGKTLQLQLEGQLAGWPEAWPALPPPLGQSDSPLPFALGYGGASDLSDIATLQLQRDDTRLDGRFRLFEVIDWVNAPAQGAPLPPIAGTLSTPRVEISGAVLEGVEMRMEDESLPAPETAPQP